MSNEQAKQRTIEAARAFSNAVNELGFDEEAFAQEIRREHPTLQQNAMRAFMELARQWSIDLDTGNFDLRNDETVKIAGRIREACFGFCGLPRI